MIAEKLKKSILQAAIQGKLTQREPGDGTAAELLQQIAAEKAKLIKEGKIKKEKPLPEITEDEKPFDLPEGWEWCRIGNVGYAQTGTTPSTIHKEYYGKYIPFIKPPYIFDDHIDYVSEGLSEKGVQYGRIIPEKSILMVCIGGSTGKTYFTDRKICCNQQINALTFYENLMLGYSIVFLKSSFFQDRLHVVATGTATSIVNKENWRNLLIPLPPLAEQQRIVARVENLLFQVDSLSKDEKKLDALQSTMPERLKASLLQAAIQGKLTERLPGDGNAEDLLAEIAAEKQWLIKAKKIKKEKPLPEITEEEKPFNLPDGWEWCRLGEITYNHGQKKPNVPFTYVDISSVDNKHQKLGDLSNIIQPDKAPSRARKIIKFGDVIYATVRPYLHNMCIIDRNIIPEPIVSTGFAVFCTPMNILNRYLFYYLLAPQFDVYANSNENAKGVAYPAINDDRLSKAMISLPPLAEQQRIVQRLEELLPLCEGILSGK
jgi:type I restriction enzyme S subunit